MGRAMLSQRCIKIVGILVICTFYCMNKELEEQKARGEIGTSTFSSRFLLALLWRWDGQLVEWDWSASQLPPYCASHSRACQAEGFFYFSELIASLHGFQNCKSGVDILCCVQ